MWRKKNGTTKREMTQQTLQWKTAYLGKAYQKKQKTALLNACQWFFNICGKTKMID